MRLIDLEADRLRNLKAVRIGLSEGLTVVSGRNGQGKTSLLEAVYLLGTGRSFRTLRLEELIEWSGGPLRVGGTFEHRSGRSKLAVVVDGDGRRLAADGAEVRLDRFLGRLAVVDLTSERMKVLRGAPDDRRRFLDRGVVGTRPAYLRAIGEYRKVLLHRNALLREGRGRRDAAWTAQADAWDERLVEAGAEVHRRRREYAVLLAARLGEIAGARILEGRELTAHYRPSPAAAGKCSPTRFCETFAEALERSRPRDLAVGHTTEGPHRDDLLIELDGVDLRRFGSAGQVRGAMINLKLAKLALLREGRGEPPLFLMDDFDSDLDEARAAALAEHLQRGGHQAIVATSKEKMADRLGTGPARVRMEDGRARTT